MALAIVRLCRLYSVRTGFRRPGYNRTSVGGSRFVGVWMARVKTLLGAEGEVQG